MVGSMSRLPIARPLSATFLLRVAQALWPHSGVLTAGADDALQGERFKKVLIYLKVGKSMLEESFDYLMP